MRGADTLGRVSRIGVVGLVVVACLTCGCQGSLGAYTSSSARFSTGSVSRAPTPTIAPPHLLDIGEDAAYHAEVFRVDPWSLRPMGRGTPLVDASKQYIVSPSRQFLAFSSPFTGMLQLLRLSNLSRSEEH